MLPCRSGAFSHSNGMALAELPFQWWLKFKEIHVLQSGVYFNVRLYFPWSSYWPICEYGQRYLIVLCSSMVDHRSRFSHTCNIICTEARREIYIGWVPVPTRYTFYWRPMSDQKKSWRKCSYEMALQFLCSCYGFGINYYNYREARSQMMRARRAKRRLRTLEIQ